MMRVMLLLLSCCLPALSAAAELHKCVDAEGVPSYQSQACPPGARTLWVRDALPEPEPARPAARVAADAAPSPPPRKATTRVPRSAHDPAAGRCAAARRAADRKRDREWNRLDFRQRSELDASVTQACRR